MSKSIVQRVKYLKHLTISEYDRDQIDPIVYLNVFKDGDTLYGFKEYDYFRNGAIKSKEWELGSYMNLQFIKKDIQTINKEEITIITRAKVVKSETQLLIEKTEKANVKLPDIAKNNWGLR